MSKLLSLKEWVTIEEAAKLLTKSFMEEVTELDLYTFALNNHITLTIKALNGLIARAGLIDHHKSDAYAKSKMKRLTIRIESRNYYRFIPNDDYEEYKALTSKSEFHPNLHNTGMLLEVLPFAKGFDEIMRKAYPNEIIHGTGSAEGIYLRSTYRSTDLVFQLYCLSEEGIIEPVKSGDNFILISNNNPVYRIATKFPSDIVWGVRTDEINRFISEHGQIKQPLKDQGSTQTSHWKQIAQSRANEISKEQPTLLKKQIMQIIAEEFKEKHIFDDNGKKSPDPQTIYKHIKIKKARR